MRTKTWVYNPRRQKRVISDQTKLQVERTCDQFVLRYLRPMFVVRPFNPKSKKETQCVDVEWIWYRHFIHFKALYKDLRPNALEAQYDYPIARLEYMSGNLFHLAYFRHTGQWWTITFNEGRSLDDCLRMIRELPHFQPVL